MTVETQTTKVTALGNGVATSFSFSPLVIFDSGDLVVTFVDTDGAETVLSEGSGATNYTVVVSSYPGTGSITYPASGSTELATGESLVMKRVLTLEQTNDLENQGGYFPDTQETSLDKLLMIDLQQQEEIDRSLKIPVSDGDDIIVTLPPAADRAGLGLVFDDDGHVTAGALSDVAVSAPMIPVVQAASLALGRTALGSTTVGDAVFIAATAAAGRTALDFTQAVVQRVNNQEILAATGTTVLPFDDTIPQITEGDQYMSRTITPKSATSTLYIEVEWAGANSANVTLTVALFQDAVAGALAAASHVPVTSNQMTRISLRHKMTSGTTSQITFRVRAGGSGVGTTTFNGHSGSRVLGGVGVSSITVTEVLP